MGGIGGTAITLENLFGDWPAGRIGQVHTIKTSPGDVSELDYFYSPKNAPIDFYTRRMLSHGGKTLVRGAPSNPGVPVGPGDQNARAWMHSQMRALADISPIRTPRDLIAWVRAFKPDLVYSLLGNVRMMRLATVVSELADVPLVPHFMDDWPTTLYSSGELFGRARSTVESAMRDVLRRAPLGLGISNAMSEEYSRRFGIKFATFGNSVDSAAFDSDHAAEAPYNDGVLVLTYAGGLHLERWRSLMILSDCLKELNDRGPIARLIVYAPRVDLQQYGGVLGNAPHVHIGGSLEPEDVPAAVAAADILVHVESFDEQIRRFTRLSLSTKIPQYLAAGRPILALGPREAASMRHIASVGAGIVVGSTDPASLRDAITTLCASPTLRSEMGHLGAVYAKATYARDIVRKELGAVLREAAAGRT
jgi:glycosyltransferase involved in cell wall biosynthesis